MKLKLLADTRSVAARLIAALAGGGEEEHVAPTFRQGGGEEIVEGTERAVAKPSEVKEGDTIVLSVYIGATGLPAPAVSNGGKGEWKREQLSETSGEGTNYTQATFVKKYEGEAGPYKVTWGGVAHGSLFRWAVYPGVGATIVNSSSALVNAKGVKEKSKALSTTINHTRLVWMAAAEGPFALSVLPPGFTSRTTDGGFFCGDKVQVTPEEVASMEATLAAASKSIVHLIALNPV